MENVPAVSTVRKWSRKFNWQAKAEEYDRQHEQQVVEFALAEALQMDQRHMENARILQRVGMMRVEGFEQDPGSIVELKPNEARAYVVDGAKLERLAGGKATERVEVAIDSVNAVLDAAKEAFRSALNELSDRYGIPDDEIAGVFARFASSTDDATHRHLLTNGIDLSTVIEGEYAEEAS